MLSGFEAFERVSPNVGEVKTVLFTVFIFLFFQDRISLCILGHLGTLAVDQASPELRDLSASAYHVPHYETSYITNLVSIK